ncbi:MAG: transcription termination/antitermination protein NusA [Deltaproteobacteria bacterium]|nr:transcription termination/antitermination protein NusA [Deltaproteobacteria bacterium]
MNTSQGAASGDITLSTMIDAVAKEKGIDRKVLVETVEQAILKAAQNAFGEDRELEAKFSEETGQVDLFMYMTVVEGEVTRPGSEITLTEATKAGLEAEVGEELGFQIFYLPKDLEKARQQDRDFGKILKIEMQRAQFGRIAAQAAKQVLIQRLRDAERDLVYNEYKDRKGELIRGIVRRFERGNNIIVDLGRTEAVLPYREQTPRETYRAGDRIVAFVKEIDRKGPGPQIILSRGDARLVEKLFEAEVPEIYEGIVQVKAVAREPGARTKIAVASRDNDVDPVGACVGMKGSRVQAVVQELRGEKIDIVPWDKDPARFVCAAIQPAEVHKVILDEADGRMELVVPDEKLSLAIGRKGQNVRLAAQLTGWKLDIISESKFRTMEDEAVSALQQIGGVGEPVAKSMYRLGFRSVEEVAEASPEELTGIPGLGGVEAAERVKRAAEAALETQRDQKLRDAMAAGGFGPRDRLMFVRGVNDKAAEVLEQHGYKTPEAIVAEAEDKLALKTSLGIKRARAIRQGAEALIEAEKRIGQEKRGEGA